MNKKAKIILGCCLLLLLIATGICIYLFLKLRFPPDTDEGMNETGLAIAFLLIVSILLGIYSMIYGYFYLQLWKGNTTISFHRLNAKITGLLFILICIVILATRRVFFLVSLGPVAGLLLLLFLGSWMVTKQKNK